MAAHKRPVASQPGVLIGLEIVAWSLDLDEEPESVGGVRIPDQKVWRANRRGDRIEVVIVEDDVEERLASIGAEHSQG